jgi:hypothetical protein
MDDAFGGGGGRWLANFGRVLVVYSIRTNFPFKYGLRRSPLPRVLPELKRVVSSPGTTWHENAVGFGGFFFDLADPSHISAQCGGAF